MDNEKDMQEMIIEETDIQVLTDEETQEIAGGAKGQLYVKYTVKRGDTLGRIARAFKTTVQAICDLNTRIEDPNFIRTGWVLLIPDNR